MFLAPPRRATASLNWSTAYEGKFRDGESYGVRHSLESDDETQISCSSVGQLEHHLFSGAKCIYSSLPRFVCLSRESSLSLHYCNHLADSGIMVDSLSKAAGIDHFAPPREDEEGITFSRDWTPDEEKRAKRK